MFAIAIFALSVIAACRIAQVAGPRMFDAASAFVEIVRCKANPLYFVWHFCIVRDDVTKKLVPFRMWAAQQGVLEAIWKNRFVILLKARQVGMTTLVVCYAVWLALFHPGSTILIFSKRQTEAKDMLKRIKQTIRRLPVWMRPGEFKIDATQELELPNGSRFITFASRGPGGDSYTADLVIIDEADLIPNLNELLEGCEPTIAANGRMILLSRVDKRPSKMKSPFKTIWRAAVAGENEFVPLFIPWDGRPDRDQAWYDGWKRSIESRTGSLDDLFAQYPKTAEEALAPRELDRRFPAKILVKCYEEGRKPLPLADMPWPTLNGLRVYELPKRGRTYVLGVDVAEGNPNSDDSTICVMEQTTQTQVAVLVGKFEPGEHGHWAARLAQWYNNAAVLVERNNHGKHTIKAMTTIPSSVKFLGNIPLKKPRLLVGADNKYGTWTDYARKRTMYAQLADAVRCGSCVIVDEQTYLQLISLDTENLEAPEGEFDDLAIAYAIAIYACATPAKKPELTVLEYKRDGTFTDDDGTDDEPLADAAEGEDADGGKAAAGRPTRIGNVDIVYSANTETYWAVMRRDGERCDMLECNKPEEAEAAAHAAIAVIESGDVSKAPADDAVTVAVWRALRERGWITKPVIAK